MAFNLVEGSGFNDPVSSAPDLAPPFSAGTGRTLLNVAWHCAKTNVNVRACSNVKCRRLRTAVPGERAKVTETKNGWLRIGPNQWSYGRYWEPCQEEDGAGEDNAGINSPRLVQSDDDGSSSRQPSEPRQVLSPQTPALAPSPSATDAGSTQGIAVGNGICPMFYKIWQGYPPIDKVPSPELVASLGFGAWITNTCAIRTTLSLRNAGYKPGEIGRTKWRANGKRYLIRVKEIDPFLTATFGAPYIVAGPGIATGRKNAEGNEIYDHPKAFQGKAGLIMYTNCNFDDATGHFDVWDGTNIRSHGYPDRCKTMSLFNVCTPISSPDYTSFIEHLRRTGARK